MRPACQPNLQDRTDPIKVAWAAGRLVNNTLLFIGDSVSIEHYLATLCRLRSLRKEMLWNMVSWDPEPVVFNSGRIWIHCMRNFQPLHPAVCFTHPLHGRNYDPLDLSNNWNKSLVVLAQALQLVSNGTRVTIVANLGLHYRNPHMLTDVTETMLAALQHVPVPPSAVIWRETSAQHFAGNGGVYSGPHSFSNGCTPHGNPKDFFNNITNSIAKAHGLPIIQTWESSGYRWDAHPGRGDCSHWCLGTGVVESWVDTLYKLI